MKKILLILAAGCTMALVSCEEWLLSLIHI